MTSSAARLVLAAVVALALIAAPRPAVARCKGFAKSRSHCLHQIRKGDTLALLGAEYYGDRDHKIFIMVANNIQHERALKPGKRLKIPLSQEVTADVGDTLDSLAQQYLGNPDRGKFLAGFNDISQDTSLAAGQVVWIPFQVKHVAAGAESLEAIAAAYFNNRKRATFLKAYNFLTKNTLKRGEAIDVPIFHVRVQRSKLPPADEQSEARARERREMEKLAAQSLTTARASWRRGDYATVKRELTRIKTEYLDTEQAISVSVLLGAAYVAFGDVDSAKAAFAKVIERRRTHALDRYAWSPKVREVWRQAGGAVTGSPSGGQDEAAAPPTDSPK